MSSGAFTITTYQASYDTAEIHPIAVQPETLDLTIGAVANAAPVGERTSPISAVVSRGKRSAGLNARTVTVRFNEDAAPANYLERATITLPWLNESTFGAIARGDAATYLAAACQVVGKSAETAR